MKINQLANLRQWMFNGHSQLVTLLEITDKSYIVFQINEEFVEQISQEIFKSISRRNFQDIQSAFLHILLESLSEIRFQEKTVHSLETAKNVVNLSRWFQNNFEVGWQTIEELWAEKKIKIGFNFRSNSKVEDSELNHVRMVKTIDLQMKLGGQSVALVITLISKTEHDINVLLQLHPVDKNCLPLGIKLIVIDESGQALTKVEAREYDNWIQQEINGVHGEHFSVEVALNDFSYIEHFVI